MKTRKKRAEEREKFLEKLNRTSNRVKNFVGKMNEQSIGVGSKSSILKIKISRDQMGSFAIQDLRIDEELPALIKHERVDDEYESAQSSFTRRWKEQNVKKNSVSTQCYSTKKELWLYVGRNGPNTVDAQTQTISRDEYGYCKDFCQFLIYGQYCGPACQFLHGDFGIT